MERRQCWTKKAQDDKDEDEDEALTLRANDLNMSCVATTSHGGVMATLAGSDTSSGNQDRALLCSPWKGALLLGVFDGHDDDGEVISDHVKNDMPKRLAEKLKEQKDNNIDDDDIVVKALKDTFCELHQSLPMSTIGGSTASVILKCGTKLYIANVGDSVSLVVMVASSGCAPTLVYETRQDRPELSEERQRIERMGGAVSSSRVMYRHQNGSLRPGIAMSRSIGDHDMIGVIAEPIVDILDIRQLSEGEEQTHILCISATDGMTDCIPPMELAESLANAFYGKDGNQLKVAHDLVQCAAQVWKTKTGGLYRDDITIVACNMEYQIE
jgi:serine/threonine protein phosphatase PrpC